MFKKTHIEIAVNEMSDVAAHLRMYRGWRVQSKGCFICWAEGLYCASLWEGCRTMGEYWDGKCLVWAMGQYIFHLNIVEGPVSGDHAPASCALIRRRPGDASWSQTSLRSWLECGRDSHKYALHATTQGRTLPWTNSCSQLKQGASSHSMWTSWINLVSRLTANPFSFSQRQIPPYCQGPRHLKPM